MSNSSDAATTIETLLARLAGEIAAQARSVEALHGLAKGLSGAPAITLAQTIDIATQHLEALAAVTAALGETVPGSDALPPSLTARIEALGLSDLRDRLLGRSTMADADAAGELDLF